MSAVTDVRHGTVAGYTLDGCRKDCCRKAAKHYMDAWRRDAILGRPRTVDAEPVRAHVRSLQAAGFGVRRVGEMAGVGRGTVDRLLYGVAHKGIPPSRRINVESARRLLDVTPDACQAPKGAWVPSDTTVARLALLRDNGWTVRGLADALGVGKDRITRPGRRVTGITARKVAWLVEHCPHPPEWARDRRGWARERAERRRRDRERQQVLRETRRQRESEAA